MSPESLSKNDILRDRAKMLKKARDFFDFRGVVEVDCPLITKAASVDLHIDLIPTLHEEGKRYLHSSPEYGMKRLLSYEIGDIYQLAHVFRQEECSLRHNPEFMMAEWYRLGISFEEMIQETFEFVHLFLGDIPTTILSYRQAFLSYAGIDYFTSSSEDLLGYLKEHDLPFYPEVLEEGKDALLNLILGLVVEPKLKGNKLYALTYYPSSQAALAKKRNHEGEPVAERFEIYYEGVELANGYHELTDSEEQKERLLEANRQRLKHGKDSLPIDEHFLAALKRGLPDCCGVAVGFDRLMMLRHGAIDISNVIPFAWQEA